MWIYTVWCLESAASNPYNTVTLKTNSFRRKSSSLLCFALLCGKINPFLNCVYIQLMSYQRIKQKLSGCQHEMIFHICNIIFGSTGTEKILNYRVNEPPNQKIKRAQVCNQFFKLESCKWWAIEKLTKEWPYKHLVLIMLLKYHELSKSYWCIAALIAVFHLCFTLFFLLATFDLYLSCQLQSSILALEEWWVCLCKPVQS